ncbi:quinone-dependent dihydroorotate dehydrogenase [Demequina sp. TTPB684]|uniref:quinone-dependent dihydroorotate dehydrogenase n=1 Tax=unclassified Demequina TaxID=2620311 RepID=UPI001CF3D998|nr:MULTISPECIES: quinone-dependent dihydroorotate dehydrogenase [unclassified Demequina]MCB2413815.1 quinone-dependent dihydroorotate dehydrogenase [Demequina sp. TTPB684]UPU89128.1 quinone-dependent dihydroorotate dehydrogenase [Demequina sp. TMPB413]
MYGLLFRWVILRMSAERAHHVAVAAFRWGWPIVAAARWLRIMPPAPAAASVEAMGRTFPGPLGLAAGLDKDATAVKGLWLAGFSHVEVGTITPKPQPGNELPRAWRELDVRGLRNRMGFNNEGADAAARSLAALRRSSVGKSAVVGVNIGKNKTTPAEEAPLDYGYCARVLAPYADYLVVNVSSPNTPGLRDLQSVETLRPILEHARAGAIEAVRGRKVPLLVKIAPDLADEDIDAIAALAQELGLDGIVATNTTIGHDRGPGGLSGPVLLDRAVDVIARLRVRVGADMCLIGVGGVVTADDARAILDAGATLVQGYTALVYEGPFWPSRLNRQLATR